MSTEENPKGAGAGLSTVWDADPAEIRATYDDWVSGGDYDRDVESWGYRIPQMLADEVSAATDPDASVLDAGCGSGLSGAALRDAGMTRLTGGDFSPESLVEARARGVYTDVVELDLNRPLAFDDAQFGAVMSSGVFTYVADGAATLRELLRIVEPGGIVAFSQRTDFWDARGFTDIVDSLVETGLCTADVSEPVAYLPGHPEFGDDIQVILTTLQRTDVPIEPRPSADG